jgi:hypothetical protein
VTSIRTDGGAAGMLRIPPRNLPTP